MKLLLKRMAPSFSAITFLLLLPILYFWPAVKGELVLMMGDSWIYSVLMRMLLGEMIRTGTLPLWNPHTFGGMPFLATIQPGVLYPPNWIFAVLSPVAAMNVVVITTYHIVLIGAYRFGRELKFDRISACSMAIVFSFGGFLIGHLEDTNYIAAAAWLPWIALSIEKLSQKPNWRWVTLGAIFIALQCFAGLPQATWQIALVCLPFALFRLLPQQSGRPAWQRAVAIAAMGLCGLLLSAIQLFPTIELQGQGERAQIDYETFSIFSWPFRHLLTLFFPYFFGGGHPPLYHLPGWDEWWTLKMAYGYVGFAGLMTASVAVLGRKREKAIWFWAGMAMVALLTSFGSNLPFEINRLLYRIPINNLFRAPYRHLGEFTFCVAVLSGYGMAYLRRTEWKASRPNVRLSIALIGIPFCGTAILYRFFGASLGAQFAPPPQANSLLNPEAFVPLIFFPLSVAALLAFAKFRGVRSGLLLFAILLADLSFFGRYTQWRSMGAKVVETLPDPPAIEFIKSRESDLHSFRILNYAQWPFGENYEEQNHANLAIPRGVQTVTGYDPMRPIRPAWLAGRMDIFGVIQDLDAFHPADQGFNLLNVKYLLHEKPASTERLSMQIDNVKFRDRLLEIELGPGDRVELDATGAPASTLALITTLSNATHLPHAAPVAQITLHTRTKGPIKHLIRAGQDTAEWAYDRNDVRNVIKHRRPRIAESWGENFFEGHRYFARYDFEPTIMDGIEIQSLISPADKQTRLVLQRASLRDDRHPGSTALDRRILSSIRWQKLGRFGEIDVYENLQWLPRAWFVDSVRIKPLSEVMEIIRTGHFADGRLYDPKKVALIAEEDAGNLGMRLFNLGSSADAIVRLIRYEPLQIEMETRNAQPGFLIVSENYYRGWEASIDGVRAPVERVDYCLRGLAVPAGSHRVVFHYRASSFRLGAKYSLAGVILIILGGVINKVKTRAAHSRL